MVIVMSVVVLIQVVLLALQFLALANPESRVNITRLLPDKAKMDLLVASIAALIVGPGMILMAYFTDFPRGYYIAVMMALAVFLMIYFNQPIYPIIIGGLIILPGVVLFLRFLKTYPMQRQDPPHA